MNDTLFNRLAERTKLTDNGLAMARAVLVEGEQPAAVAKRLGINPVRVYQSIGRIRTELEKEPVAALELGIKDLLAKSQIEKELKSKIVTALRAIGLLKK